MQFVAKGVGAEPALNLPLLPPLPSPFPYLYPSILARKLRLNGRGLMALLFPPVLSSAPFLSLLPYCVGWGAKLYPLHFPSPLPFAPFLPLEVGPLNPARESGERCKLPSGV